MPTTRTPRDQITTTYTTRPPLTTPFYFLQDTNWDFILDTLWKNIFVKWEPYTQDTQREWREPI